MTTIYAVSSGIYSDYQINAVFSTKEIAQEFVKKFDATSHDEARIEEWILDQEKDAELRDCYLTEMELDTGIISRQFKYYDKSLVSPTEMNPKPHIWHTNSMSKDPGKPMMTILSYESQEHANKRAVEYRQKWLAEKAGFYRQKWLADKDGLKNTKNN